MVLTIEIDSDVEARLRRQAQAAGKDVGVYISNLVAQTSAKPAMEELLAPLRQHFAQTGISDEDLIADITKAQSDYRRDTHADKSA